MQRVGRLPQALLGDGKVEVTVGQAAGQGVIVGVGLEQRLVPRYGLPEGGPGVFLLP